MALKAYAGGAILAEVEGASPRVLALHGWGRRGTDFSLALNGMGYLAPDLPGFGASPPPSHPMGARGYARLLEPLLGEVGPQPVLVGHSFGGRIALCLAATYPQFFSGVVFTGAPLIRRQPTRRPPWQYRLGRWAGRYRLIGPDRLEGLRQKYGSADYRAAQGVMRDVLVTTIAENYTEELAALQTPVLLLWGASDREVPVSVAESVAARVAEAELVVLPGIGHWVPAQAPEALRESVEKMLTR